MLIRISNLLVLITSCLAVGLAASTCLAQNSVTDFHRILQEKSAFDAADLAALEQGQTVVKPEPVQEKREVAVSGLVRLQVPADVFLQSFREGMTARSNPAILEIGRFSSSPTLDDLQTLTIDKRDLDDLKACAAGNCQLKLSAAMIERLHKEVNWEAPDYQVQATQLIKLMLLDYVRDYLARGDAALIEYSDKPKVVRLVEEQRGLSSAATYLNDFFAGTQQKSGGLSTSQLAVVEDAIIWSKIKFGLKPVIAINHTVIYRRDEDSGPQILISSKQIYANHYFDASLSRTAFVTISGPTPVSYLLYENRSRADGLEGVFGRIKRGIVENKAVDGLKAILRSSQARLEARAANLPVTEQEVAGTPSARRWAIGRVHIFLWLLWITAFLMFLGRGSFGWKASLSPERR